MQAALRLEHLLARFRVTNGMSLATSSIPPFRGAVKKAGCLIGEGGPWGEEEQQSRLKLFSAGEIGGYQRRLFLFPIFIFQWFDSTSNRFDTQAGLKQHME